MENELYHFGIKGMKWGVRRFQNPDGSLTPAGKARYGSSYNTIGEVRDARRSERRMSKALRTGKTRNLTDAELEKVSRRINAELNYKRMLEQLNPKRQSRAKRVVAEIAENAVKDLGRRMFTSIGDKIFNKPDTTTSEYSTKDLDKLTDKQLQDFQKRQQAKSGIIGIQKKIDAQKLEPSMKKLKDEVREAKVESKLTFREVEKVDKIIKGMSDVKTWSLSDSEESRGKSFIEENWSKSIDELYDLDHSAFVDAFLAHHGIKGQKWGVKHGPPYPLDDAVSTGKSIREKKADDDSESKQKRVFLFGRKNEPSSKRNDQAEIDALKNGSKYKDKFGRLTERGLKKFKPGPRGNETDEEYLKRITKYQDKDLDDSDVTKEAATAAVDNWNASEWILNNCGGWYAGEISEGFKKAWAWRDSEMEKLRAMDKYKNEKSFSKQFEMGKSIEDKYKDMLVDAALDEFGLEKTENTKKYMYKLIIPSEG